MMYGSKDGNIWGRMSLRIDGARVCMQRPTFAGLRYARLCCFQPTPPRQSFQRLWFKKKKNTFNGIKLIFDDKEGRFLKLVGRYVEG